jgi:predicted nucleic acid-binding protein
MAGSEQLSSAAKDAFSEGERGAAVIFVPTVVLAEWYFLLKKRGKASEFAAKYGLLARAGQFEFVPLMADDVLAMDSVPGDLEMHDRLIVVTARRLNAGLLTLDSRIVESKAVLTIW